MRLERKPVPMASSSRGGSGRRGNCHAITSVGPPSRASESRIHSLSHIQDQRDSGTQKWISSSWKAPAAEENGCSGLVTCISLLCAENLWLDQGHGKDNLQLVKMHLIRSCRLCAA